MGSFDDFLEGELARLKQVGMLRRLPVGCDARVDLCSNDYLGLARSELLRERVNRVVAVDEGRVGSTGSRLLTGNSVVAEEVEREVAHCFGGPAALIFSSGYAANLGLLSSLAGRDDVVIFDELVHASIRDGIRLSGARGWKFRHNDVGNLREVLSRAPRRGRVSVVVESVYSMDGDRAPLREIVAVCDEVGADCIVDEAHSTAIVGPNGAGLVVAEGIVDRVAARVYTFGKGLGVHGAAVVGSEALRSFLVNRARSFIYSTAPAESFYLAIREALRVSASPVGEALRHQLWENVARMRDALAEVGVLWAGESPIVPVVIPGARVVQSVAAAAHDAGFHVLPIRSPTVPEGRERIRLCVHAFDNPGDYRRLLTIAPVSQALREFGG